MGTLLREFTENYIRKLSDATAKASPTANAKPASNGKAASNVEQPTIGKAAGDGMAASGAKAEAKVKAPQGVGLGGEAGKGDTSVGVRRTEDGANITIKHEKKLPVFARNFKVWVIPCYVKGDLKASVEGTAIIGDNSGGSVAAKAGGSLELGVGGTSEVATAGPYGSIELGGGQSLTVTCGDKGWTIEPCTISIVGTGKVGIKVEITDGPALNFDHEVASEEMFVLHIGRYADGKFEYFELKPGAGIMRLIAALEKAGPQIEAAVEKYAPQFVKDAAVDGAKWAAESDTADHIAKQTGKALDKIKEE